MTSTDLAEYGRVFAAAFLGIAVTNETSILRLLIAFATLTYMVGKAALVWHHYVNARKGKCNDNKNTEADI
jgi:hypothetical protein